VQLLLKAAECRGLLKTTTSWRSPVPLFLTTRDGLREAAERNLIPTRLLKLGPLVLSERNTAQVLTRMRITLELEVLQPQHLEVTSFRELVAQMGRAEEGTDREMDPSPGKVLCAPLACLRPPDIRVQSPKSVRPVAVEVVTSKPGPDAVARRILCGEEGKELGVIWVIPRRSINELQVLIHSVIGELCPLEGSLEDAVAAVLDGGKHVILPYELCESVRR
jgi:hypothetical protein